MFSRGGAVSSVLIYLKCVTRSYLRFSPLKQCSNHLFIVDSSQLAAIVKDLL